MKRSVVALGFLTLVYALAVGSFAPYDLLLGALVSAALLYGTRSFVFDGRPAPLPALLRRTLAFGPFVFAVLVEVLRGTWDVALVILHLKPLRDPGIVEVPFGERTPAGVVVSGLADTISPGAVLLELDWENERALIHAMDASDPDEFRRHQERLYQRYQKWVFP